VGPDRGGALQQDGRYADLVEPLDGPLRGGCVHAQHDDQSVDTHLVDEADQLGLVVLGLVRGAAQHDPHVKLAGGLFGASCHLGPVVVQRGHEHAESAPAEGLRPGAGDFFGRLRALVRDQGDAAVDPAYQTLGGQLRDVAADRHRGGAERLGKVGDAQRSIALQRLQ
jgi:hypothetical protein